MVPLSEEDEPCLSSFPAALLSPAPEESRWGSGGGFALTALARGASVCVHPCGASPVNQAPIPSSGNPKSWGPIATHHCPGVGTSGCPLSLLFSGLEMLKGQNLSPFAQNF